MMSRQLIVCLKVLVSLAEAVLSLFVAKNMRLEMREKRKWGSGGGGGEKNNLGTFSILREKFCFPVFIICQYVPLRKKILNIFLGVAAAHCVLQKC
jgi:hypothetical protein